MNQPARPTSTNTNMHQTYDDLFEEYERQHPRRDERRSSRSIRSERHLHPRNSGAGSRGSGIRRAQQFLLRDQAWWLGNRDDDAQPAFR